MKFVLTNIEKEKGIRIYKMETIYENDKLELQHYLLV
jgi:hypothetical protein